MTKKELTAITSKLKELEEKYNNLEKYLKNDFDLIMKVLDATQQNTAEVTNLIVTINEYIENQPRPRTQYMKGLKTKPITQPTYSKQTSRQSSTSLNDPNAPWRNQPASEKQIHALKKQGVPITPGLTRGEASDTLSRIYSRDRR